MERKKKTDVTNQLGMPTKLQNRHRRGISKQNETIRVR